MTARLVFGLLMTATFAAAAAQERPQPAEDPCALAKRIALSPPCLAGSACEAVDLFREAFGAPKVFPAGAGRLPPDLEARLPNSEVDLGKLESFEEAFKKLGEASGIEVVLHPSVKEEKIRGELGPMPVEEAWRVLLGGFWTRVDGERLLVAKPPARSRSLGRYRVPTFDCPAR